MGLFNAPAYDRISFTEQAGIDRENRRHATVVLYSSSNHGILTIPPADPGARVVRPAVLVGVPVVKKDSICV